MCAFHSKYEVNIHLFDINCGMLVLILWLNQHFGSRLLLSCVEGLRFMMSPLRSSRG